MPSQPDLSWGPDTQDRRHRIEGHAEINLPWGMQLGTIVDYRTEAPLDIVANGRDLNGDGITGDWVNESAVPAADRRGRVPRLQLLAQQRSRAVDRGSQRACARCSARRRSTRYENNPKYFNVDATLQKRFRFGRHGIRLTAEAFNVFNFAQRTAPNISILSSLFGTYSAVEGPRAIQFTMQYDF